MSLLCACVKGMLGLGAYIALSLRRLLIDSYSSQGWMRYIM